jgi:hypothetical protein
MLRRGYLQAKKEAEVVLASPHRRTPRSKALTLFQSKARNKAESFIRTVYRCDGRFNGAGGKLYSVEDLQGVLSEPRTTVDPMCEHTDMEAAEAHGDEKTIARAMADHYTFTLPQSSARGEVCPTQKRVTYERPLDHLKVAPASDGTLLGASAANIGRG